MFLKKLNNTLISLIVLEVLMIVSCSSNAESVYSNAEKVQVVKAVTESDKLYNGFGSVSWGQKNILTSECAGTVEEFNFTEGDSVRKGQVIVRIKNPQIEFQYEQYKNNVKTASAALEVLKDQLREEELTVENRMLSLEKQNLSLTQKYSEYELFSANVEHKRELYELGGITEYEMEQLEIQKSALFTEIELAQKEIETLSLGYRDDDLIKAGYKIPLDPDEKKALFRELNTQGIRTKIHAAEVELSNAETSLLAAKYLLDSLVIRSPIHGVLGAKNFEKGEYVQQNQAVGVVLDLSYVYASFNVQEKDIAYVKKLSPVTVFIPSLQKTLNASVNEISPQADASNGSFSVKVRLNNSDCLIRPGMFFTCEIKDNQSVSPIKLPVTALLTDGEQEKWNSVFCIKNERLVKVPVSIIKKDNAYCFVEQNSSISSGEMVVDSPSKSLKEGQRVVW